MARADELALVSEEEGRLTRRFATPALVEAGRLVSGWMEEAGLTVTVDAVGNVRGRNRVAGEPLVLGSHLDTVRDAGRYDGPLGVLAAVEIADAVGNDAGPIEVVGFADEEGARFAVAYLGSSAHRGRFEPEWLALEDADGISLESALAAVGGDPGLLADNQAVGAARDAVGDEGACNSLLQAAFPGGAEPIAGYLEVHIEQGPVLEAEGIPVGVVSAIVGQTRARIDLVGRAGHAGTVPSALRADALAAAAELVLAIEATMTTTPGLVATVGELTVEPGASNVIPGAVVLSLDVRHADDEARELAVARIRDSADELAVRRGLRLEWNVVQSSPSTSMDETLVTLLGAAVEEAGVPVRSLVSGAGHDAVVMGRDAPAAMLFVRCRGGVSHSPRESVEEADVAVALEVLERVVRRVGTAQTSV